MFDNIYFQGLISFVFSLIIYWLLGFTFGKSKSIIVTIFMIILLIYFSIVNSSYSFTAKLPYKWLSVLILLITTISNSAIMIVGAIMGYYKKDDLVFEDNPDLDTPSLPDSK